MNTSMNRIGRDEWAKRWCAATGTEHTGNVGPVFYLSDIPVRYTIAIADGGKLREVSLYARDIAEVIGETQGTARFAEGESGDIIIG